MEPNSHNDNSDQNTGDHDEQLLIMSLIHACAASISKTVALTVVVLL